MSATMSQPVFEANKTEQHAEGQIAKTIEQQTAKLPSDLFLWAAGGAIATAALLQRQSGLSPIQRLNVFVALRKNLTKAAF